MYEGVEVLFGTRRLRKGGDNPWTKRKRPCKLKQKLLLIKILLTEGKNCRVL